MHSGTFGTAFERKPSTLFSNWTPTTVSKLRNWALVLSCALSLTIYLNFTQDFDGHSGNFEALKASLSAPWTSTGLQDQVSEAPSKTANESVHINNDGLFNATACPTPLDICNSPEFEFTQEPPIEEPSFGIVSIIFGDAPSIYSRAVATHTRHALRHNYQMDILRTPVAEGYWTRTSYLIGLIVAELSKPVGYRRKWLMWFDADTVIINDAIPVEAFTPEFLNGQADDRLFDDVMFVFARDDVGLNSAVFFARVHETTLDILVDAFSHRIQHSDEDLGHAHDQVCLEETIADPKYRKHALWTPRHWFNAREGLTQPGALMAMFSDDPQKEADMAEWALKAEGGDPEGRVAYEETFYASEVEEFWHLNMECRQALVVSKIFTIPEGEERDEFEQKYLALQETCTWFSDDLARLRYGVGEMKYRLYALRAKQQAEIGKAPAR